MQISPGVTARDLYMNYMFGFFAAAGCKAIDSKRSEHTIPDMRWAYSEGFEVGKAFQTLARRQASAKYGYTESIIRLAESSESSTAVEIAKLRQSNTEMVNEINEAHAFLNDLGVPNVTEVGETRFLTLKERLYTCHTWLAELQSIRQAKPSGLGSDKPCT